ncbi:hypothetical protein FRUB_03011 [Fimbriiglobus ruber]|uniref:Uncharacterized protein n=1 Tax=Fimbriiglobus ruber TaxID=1908690 RepID=A0A225DPU3_9BACT|nr:hypothetical protein FRUB_03011 [Fimbriiglobus ruber]
MVPGSVLHCYTPSFFTTLPIGIPGPNFFRATALSHPGPES